MIPTSVLERSRLLGASTTVIRRLADRAVASGAPGQVVAALSEAALRTIGDLERRAPLLGATQLDVAEATIDAARNVESPELVIWWLDQLPRALALELTVGMVGVRFKESQPYPTVETNRPIAETAHEWKVTGATSPIRVDAEEPERELAVA